MGGIPLLRKLWGVGAVPLFVVALVSLFSAAGCNNHPQNPPTAQKAFPKHTPQELTYENVSILLKDMQTYAAAVKKLDQDTLKSVNNRYVDVYFQKSGPPTFLNVYPDPSNGSIVFLMVPKDPQTGSDFLMKFDKKLPVINSDTILLQFRSDNPDQPYNCYLPAPNPTTYMNEYKNHKLVVHYTLYKRFLQSGTFDFDALTVPGYRTGGYPFIVFAVVKAELEDETTHQKMECKH